MDTYMMMLYVSLDQERALKKLFSDNGWKYLKPNLLQLTDELGGMVARNVSKSSNKKNIRVASPAGTNVTSIITIPSRPATRSCKSKIVNHSPVQKTRAKRKASNSAEKETSCDAELSDIYITTEEPGGQVDDDDFNDYMEYGDEDDDYQEDAGKDVKKKIRRLTRNSDDYERYGNDDDDIKQEDITEKLDGTEDPDDALMVCGDKEISTDDEGNESNTEDMANYLTQSVEDDGVALKVDESTDIAEKKGSKYKHQGSYAPVQYQCGFCKVKFMDKKKLNKHLTDKVCQEEEEEKDEEVETDEICSRNETEKDFGKILLEETEKIDEFPEDNAGEDDIVEKETKDKLKEVEDGISNKSKKNFYKCDQCELAYKTPYNLKTHQVMKHGMKFDESFECSLCHLSYGSEHILELHKKDKHPPSGDLEERVQCEDCEEWLDDFRLYTNHKKKQHNIVVCLEVNRSHICATCGKGFTRSDSLKNHCDIIHLGTKKRKRKPKPTERKFVCDVCGKAFLRQNNLSEHISVKHKDTAKKYKCKECGECFLRPYSLEYHTNKVHLHTKPYECDRCHKRYFSRINLRQHQDHCYKEEEEKEACPYCDKRFCHKRNLNMHLEAIHSETPLTCECGFVVKWRSSLAKHRRKCSLYNEDLMTRKLAQDIQVVKIKEEQDETLESEEMKNDSVLPVPDPESGFTTIATDSGMQVVSNDIAQALRDQGLLIDGAVAGTLKMEEGRTVVEDDPTVQSVYYVIMKE